MKLRNYPEYKDSGVGEIQIPVNWNIHKLKFLLSKIGSGITPKGGSAVYVKEGIPLLRSQNIHFNGLRLDNVVYITEEVNMSMIGSAVKTNDVLLNITGASIGRCTYVKNNLKKANVNQHVCILRAKTIFHPYLNYFLMSGLGQDQIFSYQMGTSREGLNFEQIGNFIVTYPSTKEQKRIVNYLDKKTSNIDKTIKKDTELIELLNEKRIAIINHVVTKGLDPDEKMKDSGVEWIGEIPEDWAINRLKFNVNINLNALNEKTNPNYEFYYISISNVTRLGEIKFAELMNFEKSPSRARRIPKKHDTIISTVRTYLKAIAFLSDIPENLIVSTGFAVLNPHNNIYPKFLYYIVTSERFIQTVVAESKGIAYPAINSSDLANIPIWYPDYTKQIEISNYLDEKTSEIDIIIQQIQNKIKLMEEYKKSLIHHVVTGKVDVREAVV